MRNSSTSDHTDALTDAGMRLTYLFHTKSLRVSNLRQCRVKRHKQHVHWYPLRLLYCDLARATQA